MKFKAHEDMAPAEIGQAARRVHEAKAYAAGRVKGFLGLNLAQVHAAKRFIELDYLRQIREGKSPKVATDDIQKVIERHANDHIGVVNERTRQGLSVPLKPIHVPNGPGSRAARAMLDEAAEDGG